MNCRRLVIAFRGLRTKPRAEGRYHIASRRSGVEGDVRASRPVYLKLRKLDDVAGRSLPGQRTSAPKYGVCEGGCDASHGRRPS
jgi:hypothetical protein